jgi:hypothetical protein
MKPIVIALVAAVLFVIGGSKIHDLLRQRYEADQIGRAGLQFTYGVSDATTGQWLLTKLGLAGEQRGPIKVVMCKNDEAIVVLGESLEAIPDFHCLIFGLAVTDAGLSSLAAYEHYPARWITVMKTQITDQGLHNLTAWKELYGLNLNSCSGITNDGLKHLKDLDGLRDLWLIQAKSVPGIGITDAGLAHLAHLGELTNLGLKGLLITDDGLVHLQSLQALVQLGISNCPITDTGLMYLRSLRSLRKLTLERTQVTVAGVRGLQQVLPDCDIIVSPRFAQESLMDGPAN